MITGGRIILRLNRWESIKCDPMYGVLGGEINLAMTNICTITPRFKTALHTLYSDKFRFSSLARTNDTTEQKIRISYDFQMSAEQKQDQALFEKYWLSWTSGSKLLCFSQDNRFQNNYSANFLGLCYGNRNLLLSTTDN